MTDSFVSQFRPRFPIFAERSYFATQCLGPVLRDTYDDLREYVGTLALRSRALPQYVERFAELFVLLEQLLAAPGGSVAIKGCATSCHAAIAASLQPLPGRRRILISADDFHSTRYLWAAQARRGFEVTDLRSADDSPVDAETIVRAIREDVAIVGVSLVSPRTGALLDVASVISAARQAGALVVLDAYQAVGAVPIDVTRLDADVVIGGVHKWLSGSGMGLAFMYVRPELAARLEPQFPGWIGDTDFTSFRPSFTPAAGARRFMQGTPSFEAIYGARAGLRYVLAAGIERIRARSLELTGLLQAGLAADPRIRVRTPTAAAARGGTICFEVEGDMSAIVAGLADSGIDIDFRPGVGLRASPHPVATEDEVLALVRAIRDRLP
jgi:kynureninase